MPDLPRDSPDPTEALPEFLIDPNIVVFSGEDDPPAGTVELQSLGDKISNLFGRRTEDVAKELDGRLDQVRGMLEKADKDAGKFKLSEVTVELGFSAEGAVVFVAKAGIHTTIAVKFTRQ